MKPEFKGIDPELWLQVLLAYFADKEQKQELIAGISRRSGVAPDKVEEILHTLASILVDIGRSN